MWVGGFRRPGTPKLGEIPPRPGQIPGPAGARRPRNAEGPRESAAKSGGEDGLRGYKRTEAVIPRTLARLKNPTKTPIVFINPIPAPLRTRRPLLQSERARWSHTTPPSRSWIPPRLPVRFLVRLPRQEVPGAASVAPQPSARRSRSLSCAGEPVFWCLAAVSGSRRGA